MENTRTIDLRLVLVALAVVAAVAVVWAATALAGGSSSQSNPPQADQPATGMVQENQQQRGHTDRGDCPERDRAGMASTDI